MPVIIEWCDDFLIGLEDLDNDHRELIGGINEIAEVMAAGHSDALALLETWLDTFMRHAVKEELLLDKLRQPGGQQHRDEHIAGHRQFSDRARDFAAEVARGAATAESIARLGLFLAVSELIRADYEMIGHLRREGVLLPDGSIRAAE